MDSTAVSMDTQNRNLLLSSGFEPRTVQPITIRHIIKHLYDAFV